MFNRKGFTLVELIIVVIIIGILATIAIPQYLKAVERAKIAKAKAGCGFIAQAEKMRYADKGAYIICTNATLKANLDDYVEMDQLVADPDWDYEFTFTATDAECTAKRTGGNYDTKTVILDVDAGVWAPYPARSTHPLI